MLDFQEWFCYYQNDPTITCFYSEFSTHHQSIAIEITLIPSVLSRQMKESVFLKYPCWHHCHDFTVNELWQIADSRVQNWLVNAWHPWNQDLLGGAYIILRDARKFLPRLLRLLLVYMNNSQIALNHRVNFKCTVLLTNIWPNGSIG